MCGVFGFVGYDGAGPNLSRLRVIARNTMSRGPHAFGFAWIDSRNRLKMYKRVGRIIDHLDLLALAADAKLFIGHCRFATHGSPAENINNHPHPSDGGWIVHNGVIGHHESINGRHGFVPVTGCDSESLGMLVENGRGTLAERCRDAVVEAHRSPLVMLGLWNRPRRLVMARAGNPLSIGRCKKGRYYFASLPDKLPGAVSEAEDGTVWEFTASKLRRVAQLEGIGA